MEKKDILVYALVLIALGFSLYKKYVKKNQKTTEGNKDSGSFSSVKEDDYEPYSKK